MSDNTDIDDTTKLALKLRNEKAAQFGLELKTVQDYQAELVDGESLRLTIQQDYEFIYKVEQCLRIKAEISALKGERFNGGKALREIKAAYLEGKIFEAYFDLMSEFDTYNNAIPAFVVAQRNFQRLIRERDGDEGTFEFNERAAVDEAGRILKPGGIRGLANRIFGKSGIEALIEARANLREETEEVFAEVCAKNTPSSADSVVRLTEDTPENHLRYLIEARDHISSQNPDTPEFIQRIHSDAPPVGDPTKPAMVDASYPYYNSYLLSIAYPDFTPTIESLDEHHQRQNGFTKYNLLECFVGFLSSYGIEVISPAKIGHDRLCETTYIEFTVDQADYERGRAIIDVLIRSQEKDPFALRDEINRALSERGFDKAPGPDQPQLHESQSLNVTIQPE